MADSNETLRYITAPQTDRFNFQRFSRNPEYRQVNINLLSGALNFVNAPNGRPLCWVDAATGTGLVPQELQRLFQARGISAQIYGVDPDSFALQIARQETPVDPSIPVTFLAGKGQDLAAILAGKLPSEGIDGVSIHDAIHEIPDTDPEKHDVKQAIITSMAGLLRPGGILTLNSAFTNRAMGENMSTWGRWILAAHRILDIRPERTTVEMLEPETYEQLLKNAGLEIVYSNLIPVTLSRQALIDISTYPNFINGAITGPQAESKSPQERSEALIKALDQRGIQSLERNWYEVIARKPQS